MFTHDMGVLLFLTNIFFRLQKCIFQLEYVTLNALHTFVCHHLENDSLSYMNPWVLIILNKCITRVVLRSIEIGMVISMIIKSNLDNKQFNGISITNLLLGVEKLILFNHFLTNTFQNIINEFRIRLTSLEMR